MPAGYIMRRSTSFPQANNIFTFRLRQGKYVAILQKNLLAKNSTSIASDE
jgi:hypothetical protein